MSTESSGSIASRWARLGAMFNVESASKTPDLERLLLDTARAASSNSRLFVLAASWLVRYSEYIAKQRLAQLIGNELEREHRPTLGFLLEWAKDRNKSSASRFNQAIQACGGAIDARPLSDIEYRNVTFSHLAEQRASVLSRKWGRWMADFEVKDNALRPLGWVIENNPSLKVRALTSGDLCASVYAECEAEPRFIESEAELARRCGASRPAIRDAIRKLEYSGCICRTEHKRSFAIELNRPKAA